MKRILYIDDDVGLARLVERNLGRQGFSVHSCHDVGSGISAAASQAFDAIALDHYLPGGDGMTALAQLRALPTAPPVVYVTGAEDSRLAVAALKSGAADYVVKDVSGSFMVLLASALDAAIAQVRLRRERELAERELEAALARAQRLAEERALLLEELNHRVGNSLQLIASILQLQANAAGEPTIAKALHDARDRVFAVAAVHRRLDVTSDVAAVPIRSYLATLVDDLGRSQQVAQINFKANGDDFPIGQKTAVELGMIVTELVINAVKYAYPNDGGPVRVVLDQAGHRAMLAIEDEGIGMRPAGGSGVGTRIVASMARSLGAEVETTTGPAGTIVRLSFDIAAVTPEPRPAG